MAKEIPKTQAKKGFGLGLLFLHFLRPRLSSLYASFTYRILTSLHFFHQCSHNLYFHPQQIKRSLSPKEEDDRCLGTPFFLNLSVFLCSHVGFVGFFFLFFLFLFLFLFLVLGLDMVFFFLNYMGFGL